MSGDISILHFTKERMNLRKGSRYGHMWGTVGSGLTPGTPLGRRTPEISENSGKNGNSGKSRNLHVTYQMKALGTLIHQDTSKFPNCGNFSEKF